MPNTINDALEYELDIFGQQPGMHNLYTQISLVYAVPATSSSTPTTETSNTLISNVSTRLTRGLTKLAEAIPWIAGQVVYEKGASSTGRYKIVALDDIPRLGIVDLRQNALNTKGEGMGDLLSMESLRVADFPFSMLHEDVIAPRRTLSMIGAGDGEVSPVFMVQATLLPSRSSAHLHSSVKLGEGEGETAEEDVAGIILTFVSLHNVMDMTGFGWIISILDRFCRGLDGDGLQQEVALTEEERALAAFNRSDIGKLLVEGIELGTQAVESVEAGDVSSPSTSADPQDPPPECHWVYISLPPSSLTALKALAMADLLSFKSQSSQSETAQTLPTFVSTDDVVSAFIFQSIIRARLPRLLPSTRTVDDVDSDSSRVPFSMPTTFARAIDPRSFVGIHPSYPGLVQCMNYHGYTSPPDVISMPLGKIARDLRAGLGTSSITTTSSPASLKPSNNLRPSPIPAGDVAQRTRLFATQLAGDASSISATSSLTLSRDVMLSSWANQSSLWSHSFGLGLGSPDSVRRPAFTGVESLCYIMPRKKGTKGEEAEVVVGVCLRDEDLVRLKEDAEVKRWARWIG